MLKHSQKCLSVLLTVVTIATIFNVLILFWIPINIPFSSFTVVRMTFIAFIERKYYLLIISFLICSLLTFSIFSVRKKSSIIPVVLLMYLIFDFIIVVALLIAGIGDGYWSTYIVQTLVLGALIVLLSIYCWSCLRNNLHVYH